MTLNAIIANFQTFKLVDLLDIIIIAFLIYQLLGIVNRTRAGQLFKGALLVMAVYLVAIRFLVTKDGGAAGGFAEKAQAAADTGVQLIVIRRPAETGETADQILTRCREVLKG